MSVAVPVWARGAKPADGRGALRRSVERLRFAARREGLSHDDLRQLAGELTPRREKALDYLTGEGQVADRAAVIDVLQRLEDRLGIELGSDALVSPGARLGRFVASLVGAVLALVCIYIVVGGLIEGDSLLLGHSVGAWGLAMFVAILLILGLFEALHTAATMLKIADLGALASEFPRAAALHRHFRSDGGLARFLAGRQEVVIFTVFLCSPLSSFPGLTHWPLIGASLPGVMRPFVTIGMPGALFVLWFGQLAPQFLATRHAVRLTNTRIVSLAFRVAYALEAVGLARVGFWCVAWDRATAVIPSSPALRWRQTAEELDGFGNVGFAREWNIHGERAELRSGSVTRIYRDGAPSLADGSHLVPGSPDTLSLNAIAANSDGEPLALAPTEHREEPLVTGDRRFHKPLSRAIGSFREGDAIQVVLDASYRVDPSRDLVYVERPVRYVLFRVVAHGAPRTMAAGTLRTYKVGDGLGDLTELGQPLRIEPHRGPDGRLALEHVVHFPAPNTLLTLTWEVELNA